MTRPPLIVMICGGLLAAVVLVAFLAPPSGASPSAQAMQAADVGKGDVTTAEANAWAEARASNTPAAYRVYLSAYPSGAFSAEAREALDRGASPRRTTIAASTPVAPIGPSPAQIASSCQAYVDANWPTPSRVARIGGGAAGGCAIGLLAGGDDKRNCVIGAVAGGATGEVTARSRERRRSNEYSACVANGGPPG